MLWATTCEEVEGRWTIRRRSDLWYFAGMENRFVPELRQARIYTDEEKEVLFINAGEFWSPVILAGQA